MCCVNLKLAIGIFVLLVHPAIWAQTNETNVLQNSNAAMQLPVSNPAQQQTTAGTTSTMPQNIVDSFISTTVPISSSPSTEPSISLPATAPMMPTSPEQSAHAAISAQTSASPIPPSFESTPVSTSMQSMPSTPQPTSSMTAAPAAPTPVKVASETPLAVGENTQESTIGIDTMDVKGETKGNWLYKRFWWERARKLHDEILNRVKAILAERDAVAEKSTTIARTVFADFYKKSGYEKGELDTALNMLKTDVEEQRAKGCTLNEQERAAFAALEQEKEKVEQLHKAIQAINILSVSFDDALKLLNQQIALCNSYEQQASDQLATIERELSDKQAKESYHQMRTSFENIINIEQYIKGDFAQYFANLTTKTQEHIATVMASLAALKEHGIDLTKQIDQIRNKNCELKQPDEPVKPAPVQDTGVAHWLSTAWNTVSNSVSDGYQWLRSFWSSDESATADEDATEATAE